LREGLGEGLLDKAYDREPTRRSRELRNNATPAERKLWQHLRSRQLSATRFNRQVPIGPFICDFAARTAKVIIELDGGQHAGRAAEDERRTRFLVSRSYRVLRFWNNDVLENVEGVLRVIEEALRDMPSPNPPRLPEGNR
jgi:very-short-patch-repair endonuclease